MADDDAKKEGEGDTYIIKKIKKGGGHHGGAWKVAYADFVTAMMAFFLLLWLLNVSTDEQLNAISNYFDPTHPKVSDSTSGAGGVLGGLSVAPEGAMVTTVQPLTPQQPSRATIQKQGKGQTDGEAEEKRKAEEKKLEEAKNALEQAILEVPELAALAESLIIDMTPEGLRIQIIDDDEEPMFASGSAQMFQKTRLLLGTIAGIIEPLPNDISVRGHTDSSGYAPGAEYTNWELSADRANASRKGLEDFGFPPERINNVVGKADREHLNPDDPTDSQNRRISIILLRDEIVNPLPEGEEGMGVSGEGGEGEGSGSSGSSLPGPSQPPPIGTFRKTPGAVEFP